MGFLTSTELQNALHYWVKYEQRRTYADEIISLESNVQIDTKKKFICDIGILRVGGRLQLAGGITFDTKHQMILSKQSELTKRFVSDAHHQTLHGGTSIMLSYIRQTYWIPGVKDIVRCWRFAVTL